MRDDAARVWVLDPIDGTKSFISGIPLFGTLIALVESGAPVLGVIDQPISRERWLGAAGQPTRMNGAADPARRACAALGDATLYATSPDMFAGDDAGASSGCSGAVKLDALRRRLLCLCAARQRLHRSRRRGRSQALRLLRAGAGDRRAPAAPSPIGRATSSASDPTAASSPPGDPTLAAKARAVLTADPDAHLLRRRQFHQRHRRR